MLTRLEVEGFKSLRDFAIDFEPLTVLVGPNDAGKSNILEALALISRLGGNRSPEDALKQGRGRANDQFTRRGTEVASAIILALETLEPESDDGMRWASRLRYELKLERLAREAGPERVELRNLVRNILGERDAWLASHPEWHDDACYPAERTHLNARESHFMPFFSVITLQASNLREPSERIDSGILAPDASNLPSVLAALPDLELGEIRAELAGLIPGIASFAVVEHDETYHIEFHTREREVVPARLASDGTLRMLALLTAVLARPENTWDPVICIEEPENGIYPGRLRRLIDLLRDVTRSDAWLRGEAASPAPQIILTTHSPIFLSAMRREARSLRYVDVVRRDGQRRTRARSIAEHGPADRASTITLREIEVILDNIHDGEDGP